MIPFSENNGLTHASVPMEYKATIETNQFAFKALQSDIYTDKIGAIVREVDSNAIDAHNKIGNPAPVTVILPSFASPNFEVIDCGPGMSHEQMISTYLTLFKSDKRDSANAIGGFGVGCKSPYCYTDRMTVVSKHDGIESTYFIAVTDGVPSMRRMGTKPTNETGLSVIIPVESDDFKEFESAARTQLMFMHPSPVVMLDKDNPYENIDVSVLPKDFDPACSWFCVSREYGKYNSCRRVINVGGVAYKYEKLSFPGEILFKLNAIEHAILPDLLVFNFGASEISVAISRESIINSHENITAISNKIEELYAELLADVLLLTNNQCKFDSVDELMSVDPAIIRKMKPFLCSEFSPFLLKTDDEYQPIQPAGRKTIQIIHKRNRMFGQKITIHSLMTHVHLVVDDITHHKAIAHASLIRKNANMFFVYSHAEAEKEAVKIRNAFGFVTISSASYLISRDPDIAQAIQAHEQRLQEKKLSKVKATSTLDVISVTRTVFNPNVPVTMTTVENKHRITNAMITGDSNTFMLVSDPRGVSDSINFLQSISDGVGKSICVLTANNNRTAKLLPNKSLRRIPLVDLAELDCLYARWIAYDIITRKIQKLSQFILTSCRIDDTNQFRVDDMSRAISGLRKLRNTYGRFSDEDIKKNKSVTSYHHCFSPSDFFRGKTQLIEQTEVKCREITTIIDKCTIKSIVQSAEDHHQRMAGLLNKAVSDLADVKSVFRDLNS